jgi:hypothetical protein
MQKHAVRRTREAVRKRARGILIDSWQSQANLSFFLVLEVMIAFVLPALGFGRHDTRLYADLGFSILLVSGIAIAWGRPKLFMIASIVGGVALIVRWLSFGIRSLRAELWDDAATILAITVIAVILLAQIFRSGRVTHVRIQGSIAVYLLFGIAWAHAYHVVNLLHPGSFSETGGSMTSPADWIYFSFITLTTVGYGDITPVGTLARALAIGEALVGQLYLAIMVARLVAMELIFWQQKVMENGSNQ